MPRPTEDKDWTMRLMPEAEITAAAGRAVVMGRNELQQAARRSRSMRGDPEHSGQAGASAGWTFPLANCHDIRRLPECGPAAASKAQLGPCTGPVTGRTLWTRLPAVDRV
jgi:hypothetical protein